MKLATVISYPFLVSEVRVTFVTDYTVANYFYTSPTSGPSNQLEIYFCHNIPPLFPP